MSLKEIYRRHMRQTKSFFNIKNTIYNSLLLSVLFEGLSRDLVISLENERFYFGITVWV